MLWKMKETAGTMPKITLLAFCQRAMLWKMKGTQNESVRRGKRSSNQSKLG